MPNLNELVETEQLPKKSSAGWVDGWMSGSKRRVKDCL